MNDKLYRNAMDKLPFDEDLEAKTIALLKASSADEAKEEHQMKPTDESNKNVHTTSTDASTGTSTKRDSASKKDAASTDATPSSNAYPKSLPFWKNRKALAISGTVLAAAACLVLVIVPVLQSNLFMEPGRVVDIPAEVNTVVDTSTSNSDALPLEDATGGTAYSRQAEADYTPPFPAMESEASESNWDVEWNFGSAPSEAAYAPVIDSFAHVPSATPPDWNTEEYSNFNENRFLSTLTSPLSTFAADVDTASYAKLRSAILAGDAVPADSVRIEEMLNYFAYDYAGPKEGEPLGVTTEIADCPWNPDTKLLLIGLQAQEVDAGSVPHQNLVFLIDVSGSMDSPDKLPLVKRSFQLLLEQLQPTDTISIVTYASGDRVVLDGMRASNKVQIMEAIDLLSAGGGTAGAAGIQTAYELAEKHFIEGGSNRIILATDGDLNIGISDEGSLTRLVEEKRSTGVFLSVLGFGSGNYKDNKLEALADNGNGNYAYIDTIHEARKALVEELGANFLTVAKDVKLQVEFNPAHIKGYRLIGYENRTMAAEDFANDKKDGGELGSGHRVTVLYELVPTGSSMEVDTVETKYQTTAISESDEWLTVNIRCKAPDGDTSQLYAYPVEGKGNDTPSDAMRFASAVAECGMLLRDSEFKGTASYGDVLSRLRSTSSVNGDVYKEEFQYMVTLLMRGEGK